MMEFVLAQQGATAQSPLVGFLPVVLIIVIFYLLIYRPMKTRQKNHEQLINDLKTGDKVITTGGIHGVVAGINDHTFTIKIADQVKITVAKSSIASLQAAKED